MKSVACTLVASCLLPTRHGTFTLNMHRVNGVDVPVLAHKVRTQECPVRVHDACFTSEVLLSNRCDCRDQLDAAMAQLHDKGGLLIYLPNEGRGIGLTSKVLAYHAQDSLQLDTFAANVYIGKAVDMRKYDHVPCILDHYNITSIRLLTNNALKRARLSSLGLRIASCAPVIVPPRPENAKYLKDKSTSHMLPHTPRGVASVAAAVQALKRGKPVVVLDDDDRENEGDLIVAAEYVTEELMAFFIRHTSGVICCALTEERAALLRLPPMVEVNQDGHGTAFTISVDAAVGVTTGISAKDRAATCRILAYPTASHADVCRPGHVFPLVAKAGGVRTRRGHTEATVDLCRLAGLHPCGVLSEIVTEDGKEMMRRDELLWFAQKYGLPVITIDSLVEELSNDLRDGRGPYENVHF